MADWIKAIYVLRRQDGVKDKWARAQVNLVKRGSATYLEGNGQMPGQGLKFDSVDGEVYDDVLFWDVWPTNYPRIGRVD
jgi:hypothetical protein